MKIGTIDLNKMRGISDKALGLTKEGLGSLVGNKNLEREGQAQQERAAAELKAMRSEMDAQKDLAKAKGHEAEAKAKETEQKAAQTAKQA